MKRTLPVVVSWLLLLGMVVSAPVLAKPPSAEERQRELLGIWYEIREGVAAKGDVDAKFDVGEANYHGRGTPENHEKAAHWFGRAANRGHAQAHYYLGYMHASGQGVSADPKKSMEHFVKAAELGHLEAQFYIAVAYESGRGVPADPVAAVRWYRAAAEQGDVRAKNRLGDLNLRGSEPNLEEAYLWYSLAGNRERIDEVRKMLSRSQIASADGRIRAFSTTTLQR
jgi:TPR repeat protein